MRRNLLGAIVLAFACLASRVAWAEGNAEASRTEDAARLFDEGVARFERAEYSAAAEAFLTADALIANAEALQDALTAAIRGQDPVLIARAADRALRRSDLASDTLATAHTALADALPRLASIDVQCHPLPCSIRVDGTSAESNRVYASAGTHNLSAEGAEGTHASTQLRCNNGVSYHVELALTPHSAAQDTAPPPAASPEPRATLQPPPSTPDITTHHATAKPLSPLVVVAAGIGTLALAGFTTWAGLEALSARNLHESRPDAYDPDQVRAWQRRADYLLVGALVLGAATGVTALVWVDWGTTGATQLSLGPNGLGVTAKGRF